MVRIVYFGTTEFSAAVLKALVSQGFSVVQVVAPPDRPAGRDQALSPSPVKVAALERRIPVLQPANLKKFDQGQIMPADIFVVFAYGQIIPRTILNLPRHGTINLHPSLLPKYRGPTPVQAAILSGNTETGVTIMLLDELMDHGPILRQLSHSIGPEDTTESLTRKLIAAATPLLISTIRDLIAGKITPLPQSESLATYCKMLTRSDGRVDWSKTAAEIYNQYRALTPWPGIWTTWQGKRLKLLRVQKDDERPVRTSAVLAKDSQIHIGCGGGSIEVLELQVEGKKPQTSQDFLASYPVFGSSLVE